MSRIGPKGTEGILPKRSINGCWFCGNEEEEMYFSWEWDSYFHKDCCLKAYRENNPEAYIIIQEFGWKDEVRDHEFIFPDFMRD